MKKILLLLLLVTGLSNAQIVNIPDANFKAKLIALGVDTSNDGEIQQSEAIAFTGVLDVSASSIADLEGIQAFTNITNLLCHTNQLTSLDIQANTALTFLDCRFNNIGMLDVSSNVNLVDILASRNDIPTLDLSNNPNLEVLWISDNLLTALDLSNNLVLEELSCSDNALTTLDVSANTALDDLQCGLNQLSTLDLTNNVNLAHLVCSQNQLTTLDVSMNTNLTLLDCTLNLLTDLDVSNCIALEDLRCSNNSLTTLDCTANTSLTALYIVNNPALSTVFIKNGSDESLNMDAGSWSENWFSGNSPGLTYVCADQDQVVDILQFTDPAVNVNSYCSFQPGGDFNTITGTTRFDDEGNGCDTGDITIPFGSFSIDLDATSTNSAVFTNNMGVYNLYTVETGTFTLTPNLENPTYFTVSPSPADVVIPIIDNSTTIQDFCITADGIHPDVEIVIAPVRPARPGFDAIYQIVYKNKGNQTVSGNLIFNYDDDVLDFITSTTTPDVQSTGELVFDFVDFQPFQNESIYITLNVNDPTETPAVNIGDILNFSSTITLGVADDTPDDNMFEYDQTVVGSYDPNDITCIEGDIVPSTMIGEYLHYIINFENTGTAMAENVVITTEIDPAEFDITTLQVLNASHDVVVAVDGNSIEFNFQMIALDTGGHGNILIKLQSNGGLSTSDSVNAKAKIYFDFNFPIETNNANTAFQELSTVSFEKDDSVAIYPNPTSDIIQIRAESAIQTLVLYDVQGRVVLSKAPNDANAVLSMSHLSAGIYFLKITTTQGVGLKKVLKK